jgi:nucleoside-diphosphate-sugar epimerase
MHSATDNAGFVALLIGLAKEKGVIGYPGDGSNLWQAVHAQDLASLFRLALEKGAAGKTCTGSKATACGFVISPKALASVWAFRP